MNKMKLEENISMAIKVSPTADLFLNRDNGFDELCVKVARKFIKAYEEGKKPYADIHDYGWHSYRFQMTIINESTIKLYIDVPYEEVFFIDRWEE